MPKGRVGAVVLLPLLGAALSGRPREYEIGGEWLGERFITAEVLFIAPPPTPYASEAGCRGLFEAPE
jgi:hypothetical protein